MALDKKCAKIDNYILDKKYKLQGFLLWRFSFSGVSKRTGEESPFFVEYYLVNPGVSPKEPLLSQKSRPRIAENDLQYALAGTSSAGLVTSEKNIVPSYISVRCGRYGENPRQFNGFYPAETFVWNKKEKFIKCGSCFLTGEALSGSISVSESALIERPELLCNAGAMEWKLRYEKQFYSLDGVVEKTNFWYPNGLKAVFAGAVLIDGEEYAVVPKSSYGYIEKTWGRSLPVPFFHLSSSNISSVISGSTLFKTSFAIQGVFGGHLKLALELEGKRIEIFKSTPFSKLTELHDFIEMPNEVDGQKVHWTSSFHKGKLIIDTDIFCIADEMLVKGYEMTEGGKSLLEILSGGTGTGEMRIYQKIGKNIELIEHLKIESCLCEFGDIDA